LLIAATDDGPKYSLSVTEKTSVATLTGLTLDVLAVAGVAALTDDRLNGSGADPAGACRIGRLMRWRGAGNARPEELLGFELDAVTKDQRPGTSNLKSLIAKSASYGPEVRSKWTPKS
jgi:hypothetical protein